MAQVQITDLPQALPLTGSESVPIVQNGVTVQTTTGAISGAGALNYPFLTVGSTAGLTQARYLSTSSGLTLIDNGAGSTLQINLTGAAASLDGSSAGIQVKTGPNDLVARSLAVGAGMTLSNADGVAGNPTIGLSALLQNFASLTGTGILAMQSGNIGKVSVIGVTSQTSITNGDGSSNVVVGLANNPVIPGTAGMTVPVGTTGQRPTATNGIIRYNTTTMVFEGYSNGSWRDFSLAGGVTQINTGTGLTGGPITSTGTISIADTGVVAGTYGSSTKIPQIVVNAQGQLTSVTEFSVVGGVSSVTGTANEITASPTTGDVVLSLPAALTFTGKTVTGGTFNMNAATVGSDTVTTNAAAQTLTNKTISGANNTLSNIGNSSLTNSSITINGSSVSLGGSITVTATASNALTIGTGLTGTSYNGSAPVTIAIDSTVATLTGAQTLTNKTISGASNTLTNIGNASLTNSSVTFNGVTVALGASGTITANTTNSLTFNSSGSGAASGTAFNGSTAYTISYNTIGASPLAGSTSLITLGTVTTGTWNATPIANAYLANSSVTIGTTNIALGATTSTLAGLTSVTVTQDPVSALQLATKQYVDSVAQGLNVKAAVAWGTTANITLSGLGTQAGGEWTGTLNAGDRILVKNQSAPANNGIYAAAAGAWTRTADADTWNELVSAFVFVQQGATLGDTGWTCTVDPGGTLGVTPVTWVQFSGAGTYTAGTGLTLTGTQFSITNTTVSAGSYGSASSVATFTVNAQGQLTAAATTPIAISNTQVSGLGTMSTQNANNVAITGGSIDGTTVGATTASTVRGTTITATTQFSGPGTGLTGTASGLSIGGSAGSATTATTATNLAGGSTGAIAYQSGAGATTFLSLGTTNYVLTAGASAPQYVAQSTLSVGSATNATNATNVGITVNTTNATNYLTFVSATTGNLPQLVNSSITCNPSTGKITGGIAGGSF